VWGGAYIHVGLYDVLDAREKLEGVARIKEASHLSAYHFVKPYGESLSSSSKVMDMGSGYGGNARLLATETGCTVTCIEISKKENEVCVAENKATGLEDKVLVPGDLSYFETGEKESTFDMVISQDAFLHAGSERYKAIKEAARVLKPGGILVFTDIMQSDHADPLQLQAVYKRIHLQDMGSPSAYNKWAAECGLEFVSFEDHSANLALHYGSVKAMLLEKKSTLVNISEEYVTNMVTGLQAWVDAAGLGNLAWGYLVYRKPV
jgi:cyclopropane fatty-acyl-phospholipid synthase-like methyltransferase